MLMIIFRTLFNYDTERQLTHTPIITPVTLPNLRWFGLRGDSMFKDVHVRRIITPRLEKVVLYFSSSLQTRHILRSSPHIFPTMTM
jgi:hypothetical protein